METCQQRMERIDAKKRIADFMVKEQLPYEFKVKYARVRAQEFVRECEKRDLNYHVSVGGLDSIRMDRWLWDLENEGGEKKGWREKTWILKT